MDGVRLVRGCVVAATVSLGAAVLGACSREGTASQNAAANAGPYAKQVGEAVPKIEKAIGKPVSLGKEHEFKSLFPDCAIGGMPPFGNLYGLPTYVDQSLAEQGYIVFEAGTHTDAIKMSYHDYEKIVKPKVNDLAIKLQPMKGA